MTVLGARASAVDRNKADETKLSAKRNARVRFIWFSLSMGFQKYFRRFVPDYASLSRLGRGSVSDDRFIEDPGYPPQISAPTPALREPEYTPGEPLAGLPCV